MNRNIFYLFVGFICTILFAEVKFVSAQSNLPDIFSKEYSYTVPFDWDASSTSTPVIQISINGEAPLPFQIDIGSNTSVALSPSGAKKFNIKPTQPPIPSPKGVGKVWLVDIKRIVIPTVAVEGKKGEDLEVITPKVAVFDSPRIFGTFRGAPVAGTIGAMLIAHGAVQLDFAAKVMRCYYDPHEPLHIAGSIALPTHMDALRHYAVYLNALDQSPISFTLDTGSEISSLSSDAAARFHAVPTPIKANIKMLDGAHQERFAFLPSLAIGGNVETNVLISYLENKEMKRQGIIGMNLLSRFRITFDFPNKQVFFERRTDGDGPNRPPALPIFDIVERGGKYFINKTPEGQDNAATRIISGDQITQVDGISLEKLSPAKVYSLIYGAINPTATLIIDSNGQRKEVKYSRFGH